MKKIVSLFARNYDGDRLVRNEVVPGAEWVVAGEGVATRKYDGTCCLVRDGKLYKRYEVKPGGTPPPDFEPATDVDDNTGKQQGWVPVGDGPEDYWHRTAWDARVAFAGMTADGPTEAWPISDGTYELIGPKVQGNPERADGHWLVAHGKDVLDNVPRDFDGLKAYLETAGIEGVVWRHPDGRMAKIKRKDFFKQ